MPHVKYFWDEMEDNVVEEYDGDTGSTIASYTTEPMKYGSVLSQDRGGEKRYFQFDGMGSTTELTCGTGTVIDTVRHSAFGTTTHRAGPTVTPWQYRGAFGYAHFDAFCACFIRRRVLSPLTTRWLSVDPFRYRMVWHDQYRYADNSPIMLWDSSGLLVDTAHIWLPSIVRFNVAWPVVSGHPWGISRPMPSNSVAYATFSWTLIRCACHEATKLTRCLANNVVTHRMEITCATRVTAKIVLDPEAVARQGLSLAGIYGHEQQHITSFVESARQLLRELQASSIDPMNCAEWALTMEQHGDEIMNWVRDCERSHGNPGSPSPRGDGTVIGVMPRYPSFLE